MLIYYDIETYESLVGKEIIMSKEFSAPSNYKDPIKIEASVKEQAKAALEKAALKWTTGKIVCICAMTDDGQKLGSCGDDEVVIIEDFYTWLSGKDGGTLVGKSNHWFDDGFLIGRHMANNIKFPSNISRKRSFDIDQIFGVKSSQTGSLDEYARALGLDGKTCSGKDVKHMFEAGRFKDIEDYCMQDVLIVKNICNRFQELGGWIS